MVGDVLRRILAALSSEEGGPPSPERLCEVSADVTGMTGGGVMLMSGDTPGGALCTTNEVSRAIEDLQYMLGEGPCVDAFVHDGVVSEPDLVAPEAVRWFAFTPAAIEAGARAVFAFPLRVGAVHLGALDLYRDRPGPLQDQQHASALAMADVAARWVLDLQADAAPDRFAAELAEGADFHYVVHNAAGMVSVQLGVGIAAALVRLRAYAFREGRPLGEVAEDVVARRLRLD